MIELVLALALGAGPAKQVITEPDAKPGLVAKLSKAEVERVLQLTFPKRLPNDKACGKLERASDAEDRAAGRVVPEVAGQAVAADGTRLTLVATHECSADTPPDPGTEVLLVECPGAKPELAWLEKGGWKLHAILPATAGLPALVLTASGMQMGEDWESLGLFDVRGGKVVKMADWMVDDDDCEGGIARGGVDDTTVKIEVPLVRGADGKLKKPVVKTKTSHSPCDDGDDAP